MQFQYTWAEFKERVCGRSCGPQYQEVESDSVGTIYYLFANEEDFIYLCTINDTDNPEDVQEFEQSYKAFANKKLTVKDSEGKLFVRAESRPLNCTTCFTTCGDILGDNPQIGGGPRLGWDASASGSWTTDGAPEGTKQSSVKIQFCDSVWLKEGTIYWMNGHKDAYIDMRVLCPPSGYFMYQGEVRQNTTEEDMAVDHYLFKSPLMGDCPMGDELNTESCSQELPSYLKYELTVTVPTSCNDCYGYMQMELYRVRTVILDA